MDNKDERDASVGKMNDNGAGAEEPTAPDADFENDLKKMLALSLSPDDDDDTPPPPPPPKDPPKSIAPSSRPGTSSGSRPGTAPGTRPATPQGASPARKMGPSGNVYGTMPTSRPGTSGSARSTKTGMIGLPVRPSTSASNKSAKSTATTKTTAATTRKPLASATIPEGKEVVTSTTTSTINTNSSKASILPCPKLPEPAALSEPLGEHETVRPKLDAGSTIRMSPLKAVSIRKPLKSLAGSVSLKRSLTCGSSRPVTADDEKELVSRPPTSSTRRLSYSTSGKTIKYGTGRHAHVELIPQPSDDAADPLNWPMWKKNLNFVSLLVTIALINAMKTAYIPVASEAASQLNASQVEIAALTGVPLILSSLSGLAGLTVSKVWGKRPVYLVSMLLIFIGSLWNMEASSYSDCIGARIFQGFGWGAFDTLFLGTMHDTFFEHERRVRVAIYDFLTVGTLWGVPLLAGVTARDSGGSFTTHFQIINTFYLVSLPLLAFGVPETSYDRWFSGSAGTTPATAKGANWAGTQRSVAQSRFRLPCMNEAKDYLQTMKPVSSFRGFTDTRTLLQASKAHIAPTTCIIAFTTFLPFGALWGITHALSPLFGPALDSPADVGAMMGGPFVLAVMTIAIFIFWRGLDETDGKDEPRTTIYLIMVLGVGSLLTLIGSLAFGLDTRDTVGRGGDISYALKSVQLGFLAVGVYLLQATVRPFIWRSAGFTSSNLHVCLRNVADMDAGVSSWKAFFSGVFVIGVANAMQMTASSDEGDIQGSQGLAGMTLGFGVTQVFVGGIVGALWWFFDDSIKRLDGRLMGLIDLGLLKENGSFFDHGE